MATEFPQTEVPAPPKSLVLGAAAVFALATLSGLAGLLAAALPIPRPAWTLFGFEVVVTTSAILGLTFVKGGCRNGAAIGLGSLGGCIGAASLLGYFSVQKALGGVSLTPFLAVRCLLAAALGGLAVIAAMHGDRRAWATLFKGVLIGLPAAAGIAIFVLPQGKRVIDAFSSLGGFVAFLVGTVAFLLWTASAAAGVHLVIRSFQMAGGEGPARGSTV